MAWSELPNWYMGATAPLMGVIRKGIVGIDIATSINID
jgi:hypothetical protein